MAKDVSGKNAGMLSMAAGAVGALALTLGGYLGYQAWKTPAADPVSEPALVSEVATSPTPTGDDASATPPATPPITSPATPLLPSFELVRIEADGAALIAGLAAPNSDVHLMIDGAPAIVVQADIAGNFVAMMNVDPSEKPRVMTLVSVAQNGARLESETSAIIQPAAPVQVAVLEGTTPEITTSSQNGIVSVVEGEEGVEIKPESGIVQEDAAQEIAQAEGEQPATDTAPIPPVVPETLSETLPDTAPENPVSDMPASGTAQAEIVTPPVPSDPVPSDGGGVATDATAQPVASSTDGATATTALIAQTSPETGAPLGFEPTAGPVGEAAPEITPHTDTVIAGPTPPRVLLAGRDGITVLQNGGPKPVEHASITLDSITYDAAGEVQLAGRGSGDANVRVYLNNQPIRLTQIAQDGQWRTPLPQVESGIYTLRVDELHEDGSVASRVETPFLREDASQLAAVAAEVAQSAGSAPVQAITVQPGSTLWAIAQEKYGEGVMYVRVFNANRDVIRNPDLIYPGQVFTLPND